MFFNHKNKWIACTGDERSKQNNETCWRGLWGVHVLRTWLRLAWRTQKGFRSHTHSRRGLFSAVYLMSKARALVALKCSRGFSKRCAFLPWGHRWNYFYTCAVTKSQHWGHKSEKADLVSQRPELDSPHCTHQVQSAGCTLCLGHLYPWWIIHVLLLPFPDKRQWIHFAIFHTHLGTNSSVAKINVQISHWCVLIQ